MLLVLSENTYPEFQHAVGPLVVKVRWKGDTPHSNGQTKKRLLFFRPPRDFFTLCFVLGNLSEVEFATRCGRFRLDSLARHLLNLDELQKVRQCDAPLLTGTRGELTQSNLMTSSSFPKRERYAL